MKTPKCPDCSVTMKEGWIPDANLYGHVPPVWEEGSPKRRRLIGRGPVTSYRCPECGLLRQYAFPRKWNKVD